MQKMSLMERSGLSLNIVSAAKPCRVSQLFAVLFRVSCEQYQNAVSDCQYDTTSSRVSGCK
jgi:hypothetical protein